MSTRADGLEACPVCRSPRLALERSTRAVRILKCAECGHRVASHAPTSSGSAVDYHEQYETGAFLESLEATRRRQGKRIAGWIRDRLPDADGLVDVGTGRGWFLDCCRDAGFRNLAGADLSPLSLQLTSSRGYDALEIEATAAGGWSIPYDRLSFRPSILTFLDVIEHLPAATIAERLSELIEPAMSSLRLIVVKVPSSRGILYRIATGLSRLGFPGPLEQLYQAGSDPPHMSYFSQRSLTMLLERCGFERVGQLDDPDFEPGLLHKRLRSQSAIIRAAANAGGYALEALGRVFGRYDTMIFMARPRGASEKEARG